MIEIARASVVMLVVLGCLAGFAFGILVNAPQSGKTLLPACASENSTNCYGTSFVDLDGVRYYAATSK